jgi:ParB family chromosome partitioning protein
MARSPKITLSRARDIPFDKLVPSERNVRRVRAGVSIETLAEDIARRTLLQGLSVRPIPDREGFFEVQAGGRRPHSLHCSGGGAGGGRQPRGEHPAGGPASP